MHETKINDAHTKIYLNVRTQPAMATFAVTVPYSGMVFVLEPLLNDTADARVGEKNFFLPTMLEYRELNPWDYQ